MKRLLLLSFALVLTILSCNDQAVEIVDYSLNETCEELSLEGCGFEIMVHSDSNTGEQSKISINFKTTSSTDSYYLENSDFLCGKIAYNIFQSLENIKKYSFIEINGNVNGDDITKKLSIDKLKWINKADEIANTFSNLLSSNDINGALNLINESYIRDSTLSMLQNSFNQMEKCGNVISRELIGIHFDQIKETGSRVVIVEYLIDREKSKEQHTFYLTMDDEKIIFVDLKSSSTCN